jgi:hypothetical protein
MVTRFELVFDLETWKIKNWKTLQVLGNLDSITELDCVHRKDSSTNKECTLFVYSDINDLTNFDEKKRIWTLILDNYSGLLNEAIISLDCQKVVLQNKIIQMKTFWDKLVYSDTEQAEEYLL